MPDSESHALPGSGLPSISPDIIEQDEGETIDNIVPSRGYQMVPVVGLGGSAGSIPALQKFFAALPPRTGLAFVVILHLAPEHGSMLDSILANSTRMPVFLAKQDQKVEADTVYVIPPGKFLTLRGERLRLSPLEFERGKRVAVDLFFRTLADSHGAHSAAVVLSGADGDGALGIKRVKERGGLTVAQEPGEAEHPGMPHTAIDTGMVDWVLPVEQIAHRLREYFANEARLRLPAENGPELPRTTAAAADADEGALREILAYLRIRSGRDFSCYKRATILRRISRRMQVNGATTMEEYLHYLRTHAGEVGALQQDLLISVTNFFRDREAFATLEARIPALFAGKGPGDAIRVWTSACATGEEAFSVGMLLLEHAERLEAPPTIQIFATDLAEDVIATARDALYPATIAADVSEERLRRFFSKEPRGYRIRRELRERVLFAVHDVLRDAPFSRMDLVTCRNLLIYLTGDAQQRVLDVFHFALRPQGYLFLGTSESVEEESSQWTCLDKKYRLFQQNPGAKVGMPVPLGPETVTRAIEAQQSSRSTVFPHAVSFAAKTGAGLPSSAPPESKDVSWAELHFKLIERFSPPSLIVNRDYEIVHVSQNAGRMLHFSVGEPSVNLLRVVNPMLRVELRAALFRAAQENAPVEVFRVPAEIDDRTVGVDIRVCPAQEIAPDYLLVAFDLHESSDAHIHAAAENEPAVRHLERENEQLKRRLRDVIEQYEASGEELKAGNEELQAMNEELRSSAEELETSREELQSINEELTTVNHELKSKVDELSKANSDFTNLMAATGVATIFLNRSLKITRYTPSAVRLFNLIETDLGRPLTDLTHRLRYPGLNEDAESVLSSLVPVKREVSDGDRWFLAHFLPYRTAEDQILGVVLSFVDITEMRHAQEALRQSQERLKLMLENAREYAIFSLDLDRCVRSWNAGAEHLLGYREAEILRKSADVIFTLEDREAGMPMREVETAMREGSASDERWHVRKDGTRFWGSGSMMAMQDESRKIIGLVKIFRDRTAERESHLALEASEANLQLALGENQRARLQVEQAARSKDQFIAMVSHELRTPLTPVTMALQMLERRQDLPGDVNETVAMIRRNIKLEVRLVDELLEMSRISHGKLEVVREPLELHEVIQQAVATARGDFEAKQQSLTVKLEAKDDGVIGDHERLQQAFWNVLKNASKFSPEHGSIIIVSRTEERRMIVEIQDDGIGFAPEAQSQIFEAFNQTGGEITRRYGGLGLGLAITKAIVEAHDGSVHARSDGPGQGATFQIQLPLAGSEI